MKDNTASPLILDNVSQRYDKVEVVGKIRLTVAPGEFLVIVGPSGCGKTTLLNLLSGHLQPTSGAVRRDGVIRTVYQHDGLFPWLTVAENIAMGMRGIKNETERENELRTLVSLVHLDGFEKHYPHELSGGMRQRVELARVLAGDSDILLMDEPFSALDYQTRLRLRNELNRILVKRPRTVIFVTHDIEEAAQLADRVLVLTKRPSFIRRELRIETPRPRKPTDAAVIAAMDAILKALDLGDDSVEPI